MAEAQGSDGGLLFKGVKYFLPASLSPQRQKELSVILDHNGAVSESLEKATHIITNTHQFEGWRDISEQTTVVSDEWVDRTVVLAKFQPVQYYSPDPAMIFSGIVACATGLCPSDLEVLSAGVTALGGQWRTGLTKDVTHLFALSPGSTKYETALHFRKYTSIKVLLPHWFDDAVKLGLRALPTTEYEWPDPKILTPFPEDGAPEGVDLKKIKNISGEKKALYKAALWTPGKNLPEPSSEETRDVWKGRRLMLSPSLELVGGRREAVEAGIRRSGGTVVEFEAEDGDGSEEEEGRRVVEADVLITRYRAGVAYVKAAKAKKTIGTLSWLFHVESTRTLTSPTDQLLHYPIPKQPIENFASHEITITNYTGEAREYLKKLIIAMGARFTPSMSGKNTVVIAAYISGSKTEKARSWSIPVVNHTWLEDCFVQWRNLTVGLEKYITFPSRFDFSQVLAERGLGKMVADDAELELLEEDAMQGGESDEAQKGAPVGTEASALEVNEVEDVVGLTATDVNDGDVDMDQGGYDAGVDGDVMDIDDREATPPPRKSKSPSKPKSTSERNGRRAGSSKENTESDVEEQPKKPSKKLVRRGTIRSPEPSTSTSTPPKQPTREPKSTRKDSAKSKSLSGKKRSVVLSDEEEDGESEIETPRKARPVARLKHAAAKRIFEDEDEGTDLTIEPVVMSSSKDKGKGKALVQSANNILRTPKRSVAVVIPSPAKAAKETPHVESPVPDSVLSSKKRGQPPKPKPKTVEFSFSSLSPPPVAGPSELQQAPVRTPMKRSAATKAIQKLHDEIMPDVLNYQQQMKKTGRARDKAFDKSMDIVDQEPVIPKKKRPSSGEVLTISSDDEGRDKKRRRISGGATKKTGESSKGKKRHPTSDGEDDPEDDSADRVKNSKKKGDPGSADPSPRTATIRLMTTGLTLREDVVKSLTKMGIKMTAKPAECTHLITKHLGRTEKLLCAMAVSPFILSEDWAMASVTAKSLLPEEKYALKDPDNEKKYDFKLADALARGKAVGGHLLANKVFYVTPKVGVDQKLFKNVISANGGQTSIQTPTVRILTANPNRHVISCPEDSSIWKPLVQQGYKIYSTELILTGILKQEIEWDNDRYQVPKSF